MCIDLDADDEQIDFPVLYAIGRDGVCSTTLETKGENLIPLFDAIVEHLPAPSYDPEAPFQMLVSNLGYSSYVGRLAIGRVVNGSVAKGDSLVCMQKDDKVRKMRASSLQVYKGLTFSPVDELKAGEIAIISGVEDVVIGDTVCSEKAPKALKRISVDEPTIAMRFSANSGPFAGREGKFVQSTKILERLQHETLHNVALQVEPSTVDESIMVKGRGEFQMAILLETMRREGFEVMVGRPQILFKEVDGVQLEPIEHLFIDCEEQFTGVITEKLALRKGSMVNLTNHGTGRVRLEFHVPSRGLIGYRGEFLTDTRGSGIMNAYLHGYEPHKGEIRSRSTGSLVCDRLGKAIPFALFHLEPRGQMFVPAGVEVYEGMVIGEHNRSNDLNVNPTKTKKLSNMRSSGKDEAIVLTPVLPMTLERAIEFIQDDEYISRNIRKIENSTDASMRSIRPHISVEVAVFS
ncbi:UNVERIFIED_CONTAM: hypothetical protein GTU68_064705 [Idotea baltica]|nr:hypothetical protein [Idotea baltica]